MCMPGKWGSIAPVTEKAMGLYNHCTESGGEEKGSFHASKEWLEELQKWMSLHIVKRIRESASVDHVTFYKHSQCEALLTTEDL